MSTDVSEEYITSIFRVEKISRTRNQREEDGKQSVLISRWFLAQLILRA
jgi:hypothetical protein